MPFIVSIKRLIMESSIVLGLFSLCIFFSVKSVDENIHIKMFIQPLKFNILET